MCNLDISAFLELTIHGMERYAHGKMVIHKSIDRLELPSLSLLS